MLSAWTGDRRRDRARAAGLTAEEQVRRELARELHDSVAQTLNRLLVEMETFKRTQSDQPGVVRSVDLFESSTREVLDELRRVLFNLRGEKRQSADLRAELQAMLAGHRNRTGVRIRLSYGASWPRRVAATKALQLLRIVGEAVTNAERHSGSPTIDVSLRGTEAGPLVLTVKDRGDGFSAGAAPAGLGLVGMRERVLLLGGTLRVDARPGAGTHVHVSIPREELQ